MRGGLVGRTTSTRSWSGLASRQPFSLPSSHTHSSSSSNNNPTRLTTSAHPHGDKHGRNDERSNGVFVNSVFGSVPTRTEVQHAVSAFQSFMQRFSSSVSGLESLLSHQDARNLQSPGFERVYDAFRLLQTVPSVQKMVVSISADRAVWNAVMQNKEVQEFQQSFNRAQMFRPQRSDGSNEEPDLVSMIFKWILDNMKLKVMELIEILKSLLSKSFQSEREENTKRMLKHQFEEIICSTVLLSIITLMIVLVNRAYGA